MSTPTKRIAFRTLGCKLNFAEMATIARNFIQYGFERVDFREDADIYVINTCSVTNKADKGCRKIIRQVRRRSPDATIAVIGCYAQLKPDEVAKIPGVQLVLGSQEKFSLFEHLSRLKTNAAPVVARSEIAPVTRFVPSYSTRERTRAYLKIQDGCDYACSFCTIPLARGRSRSDTLASTLKVARKIARTETREIVLTGVNLGDFGVRHDESFFDLIRELDRLEGIDRIRISSIEPNLLSDDIIEFVTHSKIFVPHFHIPLQSGSNKILKAMRRRYRRELFADRVAQIKSRLPDCSIGVDVIVGFPGESEADFLETYTFLNELDITYLHVFTYSERDNTRAMEMKDQVPLKERSRRSKMLHNLSNKKRYYFQEQFLGRSLPVLFETNRDGQLQGHTENYIPVRVDGPASLVNTIVPVKLVKNRGEFMAGESLL